MEILQLKLINYRNFQSLDLSFQNSGAILSGANGSGKTNLLEAISLCAFGKSFQTSLDSELINFQADALQVRTRFRLHDNLLDFQIKIDKKQKHVEINQSRIRKLSELYNYLKIIYFSPADIQIAGGSPVFRRSFLDQALAQYSFSYLEMLKNYYRILKQRNALLKNKFQIPEKKSWDEQLIQTGAKIIESRLDYLGYFQPLLLETYHLISGGTEPLQIEYEYSFPRKSAGDLTTAFHDHLLKIEKEEIENQRTLSGPHLDDLKFLLAGKSARKYSSQGQKRSLVIALRLVQA
ncbi:MAG: DNA replication and repair protein RecF, partial [Candidatus Cloacimonetes bacterium]|nr:DNA replication and repair protein RecF [Candidatus Cloacimonadota bacterium]